MTIKIDHVAVVVEDMAQALTFWQDALGLKLAGTETNLEEAVNISFLEAGEPRIELLQPTNPESGIGKYLAKRGAGVHHICVAVPDIRAAMNQLRAHHVTLINDEPKTRPEGTLYCFVHPKSTGGVLVELYEPVEE